VIYDQFSGILTLACMVACLVFGVALMANWFDWFRPRKDKEDEKKDGYFTPIMELYKDGNTSIPIGVPLVCVGGATTEELQEVLRRMMDASDSDGISIPCGVTTEELQEELRRMMELLKWVRQESLDAGARNDKESHRACLAIHTRVSDTIRKIERGE